VPFIVMERLPGRTFADEIADGPTSIRRVRDVVGETLDGLAAAHARGVLHRDVKPANILLGADGHVKLTDFGIATSNTITSVTAAGLVVGTPAYLAPERIRGDVATPASDIYSVGVICYEALSGKRPFPQDTPLALADAIQHARAIPLHEQCPQLPIALASVVERAMAPTPETRYGSASAFARDLRAAADHVDIDATQPVSRPRSTMTATRVLPVLPEALTPTRRLGALFVALTLAIVLVFGIALETHHHSAPTPTPTPASRAPSLAPSLRTPFDSLEQAVKP
jgi:serine/threonine-protein kinase